MEDKKISPEESLGLINRMIHEGQDYFYETGIGPIVYGTSVLVCSLLAYAVAKGFVSFPFHPYYLLIPVFAIQGWLQFKEDKKKKAKTFTDETIDYVWLAYSAAVVVSLAASFAGLGYITGSIVLLLTGFATLLTGLVAKFKYNIICGCIVWVLAIASFYMQNPDMYLLIGLMGVLAWIVTGFIMRAYFKKLQHG